MSTPTLPDTYRALRVFQDGEERRAELQTLPLSALPDGEVLIGVSHSSLNYKDGLAVTGAALWRRSRPAARAFLAAAAVYGLGGLLPTLLINVPMNEALAAADPTRDAAATWGAYSPRWQVWNAARTVASGAALLLAGWGTWRLGRAG